jgi:hypothetical protein
LFKYPPIETPITLIKLAVQVKGKLSLYLEHINKKIKKRNDKIKITNNNTNTVKHKKETNGVVNSISTTITVNKEVAINSDKRSVSAKRNSNENVNSEDQEKYQIVNRLEEICKKYKNLMDPEDNADFENIVETLKSNLSD